jgi:uncharacterized protein (DUF488 family)
MALVYTIGHSTHPIGEFVAMLRANRVTELVDVRTVRGSRHNPQYGETALANRLASDGLAYRPMPALGGLRHTRSDESVNGAWRNKSFRSYADYMQTAEFSSAIEELMGCAQEVPVAIMCAEAVPWRCHRSLIGDALLVRGVEVVDIISATSSKPHRLTSFAVVDGVRVWYPATAD